MPYNPSTATYTPDFTGQYGPLTHQIIYMYLPDQARYQWDENEPFPLMISTLGNGGFAHYSPLINFSGVGNVVNFVSYYEWAHLEEGIALAIVGFDGTQLNFAAHQLTPSRGRVVSRRKYPETWDKLDYSNNFVDFGRSIQKIRSKSDEWYIDGGFIGAFGVSSAGQTIMYSAFAEDLADDTKNDYRKYSNRLQAVNVWDGQVDWYAFSGDVALGGNFEPFAVDPENWDDPGIGTNIIGTIDQTPTGVLDEFSVMQYAFATPELRNYHASKTAVLWTARGEFFGSIEHPYVPGYDFNFTGLDTATTFRAPQTQKFYDPSANLDLHDPHMGATLIHRLRDIEKDSFHSRFTRFQVDPAVATGISATGDNWPVQPDHVLQPTDRNQYIFDLLDPGFRENTEYQVKWFQSVYKAHKGESQFTLPEYHRDVYGDASIAFVPAVSNYNYVENVPQRGINERTFRWEEVQIPLDGIQSGMFLNYIMPDEYVLQITPDIGWHNDLTMFNDPNLERRTNPHLVNIGPISIENGTLTDNADGSVQTTLTEDQFRSATIDGYSAYKWRAVPWGDGNPGKGGVPVNFDYISTQEQLKFTVDEVVKETKKAVQCVSGTKAPRVTISTTDSNQPGLMVEQTKTTWKVTFVIDKPKVKFTIVATDAGGSAVGKHVVDLEYESFRQYGEHVWNSFDGFALAASLDRLPKETNEELKQRILDAYIKKGGTHYAGLITAVNRELGLSRFDEAIQLERAKNTQGVPHEAEVDIESNHTRVSIISPSLRKVDEIKRIDSYHNTVYTSKRIRDVEVITKSNNIVIPKYRWEIVENVDGNEIRFHESITGEVKITYSYKEDVLYSRYPNVLSVVNALNAIVNPDGLKLVVAKMNTKLGGHEKSQYLYRTNSTINENLTTVRVGWSRVGLFKIADEEYKWSHADNNNMFFDSDFYQFVVELKSRTNIEWGFVVADQDFWDSVDADDYGRDSLPVVFDPDISHFVTAVPVRKDADIKFDPWEAFRMGYYFEGAQIKNTGLPREAFKSGVGFKQDCAVSVHKINVSATESKINQNPIAFDPKNTLNVELEDVQDLIVDL